MWPEVESTLWRRLNEVTVQYVHSWDPVPRLPGSDTWVEEVILAPRFRKAMADVFGVPLNGATRYRLSDRGSTRAEKHVKSDPRGSPQPSATSCCPIWFAGR